MIELRIGTWDYYQDILEMCRKFHQASPYNGLEEYDESRVAETVMSILDNPVDKIIVVLVDTENNKAVGLIMAVATTGIFNRNKVSAELAWWVNPEHRSKHSLELLEAYLYWSQHKAKCQTAQMALLEDGLVERLSKVYKRKGLKATERAFIKVF